MLSTVHVMGDYWHETANELSKLGELIALAKDKNDAAAVDELSALISTFARSLSLVDVGVVIAVPPGPNRDAHPVPALATAVSTALGVTAGPVLTRQNRTARLRDTALERRRAVVEEAGYSLVGTVAGRHVLLVDDVVLTGTTLGFLAEVLCAAGAKQVDAIVAARTRLA